MSELTLAKGRQQEMWGAGDYAAVATPLQIVAETLCEAVDLRAGWKVLDVATGTGNTAIAAARRRCHVTGIDYVPALLERGRERAWAERLEVRFIKADAEHLPFYDGGFDAVLSTFGVMFAPWQERAARELLRVCRPGGRIALAGWTREGFVGRWFAATAKHVPPPAGLRSPLEWGSEARLAELFPGRNIKAARHHFVFRYRSPQEWLAFFRTRFGPMLKAFAALEPAVQQRYETELLELARRFNQSGDDTLVAPGEYLEAIITV